VGSLIFLVPMFPHIAVEQGNRKTHTPKVGGSFFRKKNVRSTSGIHVLTVTVLLGSLAPACLLGASAIADKGSFVIAVTLENNQIHRDQTFQLTAEFTNNSSASFEYIQNKACKPTPWAVASQYITMDVPPAMDSYWDPIKKMEVSVPRNNPAPPGLLRKAKVLQACSPWIPKGADRKTIRAGEKLSEQILLFVPKNTPLGESSFRLYFNGVESQPITIKVID
jgi:hypothetical protein